MTAHSVSTHCWPAWQALSQASPDLMRSLLSTANARCSQRTLTPCAEGRWGQQTPQRQAQRNGYRYPWTPGSAPSAMAIPSYAQGTYFPEWLLPAAQTLENALITVIKRLLPGRVSTRRVDKARQSPGDHRTVKSQVSQMATDLDEHVDQFRNRPLVPGLSPSSPLTH